MNQPVDPVTPEVACRSADRGMSALVDNFLKLAHSLQKHGIVCEEAVPELYSRKIPACSPEVRPSLSADGPGALCRPTASSRPTREEACQLLHKVLSQTTQGLQKSLLKDASNVKHAHARESTNLQKFQALQEPQYCSARVPVLLVLDTPFSENPCKTTHTSWERRDSSTSQYMHHDSVHMLDITRKSIARDKQRKSGAKMLLPHVHVEQGCSYLGVQTWEGTVPHQPANSNLIHGYRGRDITHTHSISPSHANMTTWVPGGRNKQTFNRVAAAQAHVGVAQKTSTGFFSSDVGILRPATLPKGCDRRYASSMSPKSLCLPSAADALRGQPRCHRAFLTSSGSHITSASRSLHVSHDAPISAQHLDLTCPRDRLIFDLLNSRNEAPRKHFWDTMRRTITSSASTFGRVRPASAYTLRNQSRKQGSETGLPQGIPQRASRWDPCSSLDASHLGHLRSCGQNASFDATGRADFHSNCEDTEGTEASMHSGNIASNEAVDGNAMQEALHSSTNEHIEQHLRHFDTRASADESSCSSFALEDLCSESSGHAENLSPSSSVDHQPPELGHQEEGIETRQPCCSSLCSRKQDAASALPSADGSIHNQASVSAHEHGTSGENQVESHENESKCRTAHFCNSAASASPHLQQCSQSAQRLPAASSQLQQQDSSIAQQHLEEDSTIIQQHLDQAYALIDYVSLSVNELYKQVHSACSQDGCSPDCVGNPDAAQEHSFGHIRDIMHAAPGMDQTSSPPKLDSHFPGTESELVAQQSTIVGQLGDIRQSMHQLQTAHLQAMHEAAQATLAVRTGRIGTMMAQLTQTL